MEILNYSGILPLLWNITTVVEYYHCCGILPLVWNITTGVEYYHWCGILPLLWNITTVVEYYHCCGILPLLWNITTVVEYYHCCGILPLLWNITTVYKIACARDFIMSHSLLWRRIVLLSVGLYSSNHVMLNTIAINMTKRLQKVCVCPSLYLFVCL